MVKKPAKKAVKKLENMSAKELLQYIRRIEAEEGGLKGKFDEVMRASGRLRTEKELLEAENKAFQNERLAALGEGCFKLMNSNGDLEYIRVIEATGWSDQGLKVERLYVHRDPVMGVQIAYCNCLFVSLTARWKPVKDGVFEKLLADLRRAMSEGDWSAFEDPPSLEKPSYGGQGVGEEEE